MAAVTAAPKHSIPALEARPSGRSVGWWGTVCLIATEAMLFALLLFGNFYIRANSAEWPQGGIEKPELWSSLVITVVLLSSSIPAVFAERSARQGKTSGMIVGMVLTFLMGSFFLVGHIHEYFKEWPELKPSTNAYGSIYYTITGLHALHVLIGLIVLLFLLWHTVAGRYSAHRHEPVQNGLMYWHFVDAVWLFVYSSLYLSVIFL